MVKLSLFSQITSLLPRNIFSAIVKKYDSNKFSKGIDSWTHLVSMIFCHLGHANSVRDISNGLRSIMGNIVHLGCSKAPSQSSISYINEHRTSAVFEEFYYALASYLRVQTKFAKPALHPIKRYEFNLFWTAVNITKILINGFSAIAYNVSVYAMFCGVRV